MYRMSVMYPTKEGAEFDFDYYRQTHMPMALVKLEPYGMIRYEIDKGIGALGGQQGPTSAWGTSTSNPWTITGKALRKKGPNGGQRCPITRTSSPIVSTPHSWRYVGVWEGSP